MAKDKYRVVRRLDAGGMAEVYLGEAESLQGFKKKVAIKRVLPELAQNRQFIGMFLDEARIGLHLNHANVVQVFDIGVADDTYFIVMEYVDGTNLKTVLEAARQRGTPIPVAQAVYLLIEVCKALSYAHELTDESGRSRGLVHRDVSPPNVLISKRGEVKLVDFGLAKAAGQLEQTDPGVIKGKFSYLSPEAVSRQEVDARADIFASGILLWEILTNTRLFDGETDLDTVDMVRRAEIPSVMALNPQIPPALEAVVRRALARDRTRRYQSAREFGDALADVLFAHGMKVTNFDIGSLVTEFIAKQSGRRDEPSRIERLIEEELLRFTTLEETPFPTAAPVEGPPGGAVPLDGSNFEDPRGWAGELLNDMNAPPRPPDADPHPPSGAPATTKAHPRTADESEGLATLLEEGAKEKTPSQDRQSRRTRSANRGLKVLLLFLTLALVCVAAAIVFLKTQ